MTAIIESVSYIPSESDSYIQTGFKRGQYPDGGMAHGANGTYRVVYATPADIEVVCNADGRRLTLRIGVHVRRICGWCKLTTSRGEKVADAHPARVELVEENGQWRISETDLQSWLHSI